MEFKGKNLVKGNSSSIPVNNKQFSPDINLSFLKFII